MWSNSASRAGQSVVGCEVKLQRGRITLVEYEVESSLEINLISKPFSKQPADCGDSVAAST
jgi:hypothetical protein